MPSVLLISAKKEAGACIAWGGALELAPVDDILITGERLERSPHWVWVAIDPVSKLLLAIDVGECTLAMAQHLVHHVVQILAPGCVPLFLTDGFTQYATALLTHFGQWVQPPRQQATGPAPKPRWMPLPQLLYAQVVKQYRRRCLVGVCHRVVFGTMAGVRQVLAVQGWHINTAFLERLNLTIRQHVAAGCSCPSRWLRNREAAHPLAL